MNQNKSIALRRIKQLLVLIFQVSILVDLISGFCQVQLHTYIPICPLLRVIIMAAIIYLLSIRATSTIIRLPLIQFLFFLIASSIWVLIYGFEPNNSVNIGIEIESFSKILYFLLMLDFFIVYRKEIERLDPLRIISIYGLLISAAVVISFLTGFGNETHNMNYGFGSKSYFKGGNDLGLTILYTAVVSSLYLMSRFEWRRAVILLIISSGAILIGSRVGLIGIFSWLTMLIYYIVFIYRPHSQRLRIKLHHFKPIILFIYIIGAWVVSYYLLATFDDFMLYKYSSTGLRTARTLLTDPAEIYISKFYWYEAAFGKGVASLYYFVAQSIGAWIDYRMVEADFHELLGGYGFIGFVVIISPFFYFFFKALKRYFSHPNFTLFAILFVTASFLVIAYVAGHCLRNTMVAPIYAYIVSLMYYEKERSIDK